MQRIASSTFCGWGYWRVGEEIIYNYKAFSIISGWKDLGLEIIKTYHGVKVQCHHDIIYNLPQY